MAENKTRPTHADVQRFLAAVEPERRRDDAHRLDQMFRKITRWEPRLWGASIIGYRCYHYIYDSGREGDYLATGFAARKSNLVIYIMPGYGEFGGILADLGKHKLGKSCLYINRLADVDERVLDRLIRAGLEDLKRRWEVFAA